MSPAGPRLLRDHLAPGRLQGRGHDGADLGEVHHRAEVVHGPVVPWQAGRGEDLRQQWVVSMVVGLGGSSNFDRDF